MASIADVLQGAWKVLLGMGLLAAAVLAVLKLGDFVSSLAKARLNRFEKEMLAKAAQHEGKLYKVTGVDRAIWIQIGNRNYGGKDDPSADATYVDAFEKLTIHGCVTHQSGLLWVLSKRGWKLGRKYQKNRRHEQNAG